MPYHIIALLILLFLSAFFSGSETSLFSLNKISVRHLKINNVRNSNIVESLLDKPTNLLITILIGNMFSNVFASSIAASFSIKMWGKVGVGVSIATMTVIIVIFCEIMPKIIAIRKAKYFALFVSPFIYVFSKLVFPIRWILSNLTGWMLSFFEKGLKKTESDITKDELASAIKVGYSKGGILNKNEAEMIEDVLQLSDKRVGDVMVCDKDMVSFSATMPIEEICVAIKEAELSRVPVYEKERMNIVGILYAKDLLKKRLESLQCADIKGFLRKPFYVNKDMRLSLLLREFRTKNIHLAIVNDENGKIIGLITLEDLLEEIIGDIHDKGALVQRIRRKLSGAGVSHQSEVTTVS